MIAITEALRANREALDDIVVAAEGAAEHWATPRAPGKWSPSQVVEHVARSLGPAHEPRRLDQPLALVVDGKLPHDPDYPVRSAP